MKQTFYYAALDLTVVLESGHDGFLKTLSENELLILQNNLWMTITGFLTTRALYLKDTVESLERIEQARKQDEEYRGED